MIKSFEQFLLEEKVPPEIEKKYGQILFGDFRKMPEIDTTREMVIFEKLRLFVNANIKFKTIQKSFIELLKIKNETKINGFDEILNPFYYSTPNYLYRGISLINANKQNYFTFEDKVNLNKLQEIKQLGGYCYILKDRTVSYKPVKEIESWTINPDIAFDFAGFYKGIVLVIEKPKKIEKELLFEPDFMNQIGKSEEDEIIRISKNSIKCQIAIAIGPNRLKEAVKQGKTVVPYHELIPPTT